MILMIEGLVFNLSEGSERSDRKTFYILRALAYVAALRRASPV